MLPGGAGDFTCKECLKQGLAKERNCDGKSNPKFRWTSIVNKRAVLRLNQCPLAWIATTGKRAVEWCEDYKWLQRGILPHAGGRLDQPSKWVAAMDHVELEQRRAENLWRANPHS